MKRITSLTEEQKQKISVYREKWLKIGLSTEGTNESRAEEAIKEAYRKGGYDPPKAIIWCDSPLSMAIVDFVLKQPSWKLLELSSLKSPIKLIWEFISDFGGESFWQTVKDSVLFLVKDSVDKSLKESVWRSVEKSLKCSIMYSARENVKVWVADTYPSKPLNSVNKQVYESLQVSLTSLVKETIVRSVEYSVLDSVKNSIKMTGYQIFDEPDMNSVHDIIRYSIHDSANFGRASGQHSSDNLSLYNYLEEVLGITECQKLIPLNIIAEECSWWIPREDFAVVSRKPIFCSVDADRQLHNDFRSAIEYADGFEAFAINGVHVPEKVVTHPHEQEIEEILDERYIEVKRIRIERYGWQRFLEKTRSKVIDSKLVDCSDGGSWLESLYYCQLDNMKALVTYDPSTGRPYFLEVDPQCDTCEQAQRYLLSPDNILEGTGFDFKIKTYPKMRT